MWFIVFFSSVIAFSAFFYASLKILNAKFFEKHVFLQILCLVTLVIFELVMLLLIQYSGGECLKYFSLFDVKTIAYL